jgi:CheY-like chemotaxis protein
MLECSKCGRPLGSKAKGWKGFMSPDGRIFCDPCTVRQLLYERSRKTEVRALFVDDHIEKWQYPIGRFLEDRGIGMVPVPGSDEALALLEDPEERFEVIVQDFQRPSGKCLSDEETDGGELSGLAFLERHVRRVRPGLPCMFITAAAEDEGIRRRLDRAGRCTMLRKPVDLPVLAAYIHRAAATV